MRDNQEDTPLTHYQDLLFEYAVGSLPPPLSLAVAAHLSYEPEAYDFVRRMEAVGGALLENEDIIEDIAESLLEVTLAKLDSNTGQRDFSTTNNTDQLFGKSLSCFPLVLQNYIADLSKQTKWVTCSDAMEMMCLSESLEQATDIFLTRVKPGGVLPDHKHDYTELTFVIDGAFSDENGQYREGSLAVCKEGSHHTPRACPEKGCVCLCVMSKPLSYSFFGLTRLG